MFQENILAFQIMAVWIGRHLLQRSDFLISTEAAPELRSAVILTGCLPPCSLRITVRPIQCEAGPSVT